MYSCEAICQLTNGGNNIGQDVVLDAFLGKGFCEADHGELGRRVVGLAEVSKQASSRGCIDDTSVLLFSEVWPGGASALVGTLDMDLVDKIPVLVCDVLEADIAEDASVVEEDIDAAKSLDSGVDDAVAELDAVVVGNGLAASGSDLVDYDISSLQSGVRWLAKFYRHCASGMMRMGIAASTGRQLTLEEFPSPLKEPPRSLTTTLAPREAKKRA